MASGDFCKNRMAVHLFQDHAPIISGEVQFDSNNFQSGEECVSSVPVVTTVAPVNYADRRDRCDSGA